MDIHDRIAELQARVDEDQHASLTELDELIADRNEAVYEAAGAATSAIFMALVETVAPSFTCTEIEALADLYRALGFPGDADDIIVSHARGDEDEDDQHHDLYVEDDEDAGL